jgi:hypothetical protein
MVSIPPVREPLNRLLLYQNNPNQFLNSSLNEQHTPLFLNNINELFFISKDINKN